TREFHVTALSLTIVMKDPVVVPKVVITVLLTRLAGKQDDEGTSGRCGDTALSLATQKSVDLVTATVKRPHFKGQGGRGEEALHRPRILILGTGGPSHLGRSPGGMLADISE